MLKQNFSIKGRYLKAPSSRIYLKLTVTGLPDSSGTMLQVCDGETLWDYQQILEQQTYRKLSIKPIFEQLNSPEIDAKTRDQVMTQLGFAGPEALLVGLRKSVKFDQKEEDTLDGKPVWVLRGTWRNRNGLVGPDQRPLPPTGPLPAFVPSLATLYLGQKDGWPYKMVLVGKIPTILQDTRRVGPDGRLIGSRASVEKVEPSTIRLTYSNVQLEPVDPARGVCVPGSPRRQRRGHHRDDPQDPRPGHPDPGRCRNAPRPPSKTGPFSTSRSRSPRSPPIPPPSEPSALTTTASARTRRPCHPVDYQATLP